MADSVDRVFAHALSTVRKIPRTGSARPPSSDRLALYGLYKQSMEGNVLGIMPRPLPSVFMDPDSETYPDASQIEPEELAEAEANAPADEKAEVEKWDAWKACEGLSKTEAKKKYIEMLIRTMRMYASGTEQARALVEELEFVWEQVRGNYSGNGRSRGTESGSSGSGRGRTRGNSDDGQTEGGLRVLRPMSESGDGSGRIRQRSIAEAMSNQHVEDEGDSGSEDEGPAKWRRRMERAIVQMTAEVAALKELVDATASQRRLWNRTGKKGWFIWAWLALWKLIKRAAVDAMVVAAVVLVLRWRYRERVEEWWEWLGEMLGFVGKRVKQEMRKRDVKARLLGK